MKLLLLLLLILTFVAKAQDEQGIDGEETGGDVVSENVDQGIENDDDDEANLSKECPGKGSQIEYRGNSGKFGLVDRCEGTSIIVQIDSITEVTPAGEPTKNKVNTIANSRGWASTQKSTVTRRLQEIETIEPTVASAEFKAALSGVEPAVLGLWMDFILQETTITTAGGETKKLYPGTAELTMTIENWPIAQDNKLIVALAVSTNNDDDPEVQSDGDGSEYVTESAKVENALQAQCLHTDGTEGTLDVEITFDKDVDNGVLMLYVFPHCIGTIVYDPFYTLFHTGNANVVSVWMVCVATMVLSLFSV